MALFLEAFTDLAVRLQGSRVLVRLAQNCGPLHILVPAE